MHLHLPRRLVAAVAAATLLLGTASAANAGLFRSYLSRTGVDTNPCTLSQPCRLLPAALAAVNEGGEVWMLDSANYNTAPVVIGKSVTILAVPGALGSIVGKNGNAVSVGTPGVELTLRNLSIVYLEGAGHGIEVTAADARVTVENSAIFGFLPGQGDGIRVEADATLTVVDSTLRNNTNGIVLRQGIANVSRTMLLNNDTEGLVVEPLTGGTPTAYVSDSVASGNYYGMSAYGDAADNVGTLVVTRSVSSNNISSGFDVWGGFGVLIVGDSVATGNESGIVNWNGGASPPDKISSLGTNLVVGNSMDDVYGGVTAVTPR